ncbi:methyltransferase domain-containing protein [Streptomyces sp. NPDC001822]|uniref:methyltransferase domain-containing protein n=1 Tax=Streptomyces sp. NPDC001822 TaxID=3364614 RepID=UPI00368E1ADD
MRGEPSSHGPDLVESCRTFRTGRGTAEFYERVFGETAFPDAGPVLDVGAGDSPFGRVRPDVVRVDPGYAYDPPEGPGAVAALGQTLPFRDHAFSTVLGSFVVQHVLDAEELLHELLRVLRPAGTLALHPVWRPRTARRTVDGLGPGVRLFNGGRRRGTAAGLGVPRSRPVLPTLVVRRPPAASPAELALTVRAVARSGMLAPPAVVAVPARWAMGALVRVRGTARVALIGHRAGQPSGGATPAVSLPVAPAARPPREHEDGQRETRDL